VYPGDNRNVMQSNNERIRTTIPNYTESRFKPWPNRLKPFLKYIETAMSWNPPQPFDETEFKFESTREAAEHNFETLRNYEFDLHAAITGQKAENTPLKPGSESEFRPIELLNKIFCHHPLWPRARETLNSGFTMPLASIPDTDRLRDVIEALQYGNHK
jgi:hypothetical protein